MSTLNNAWEASTRFLNWLPGFNTPVYQSNSTSKHRSHKQGKLP
jgi:hypothetical protein